MYFYHLQSIIDN